MNRFEFMFRTKCSAAAIDSQLILQRCNGDTGTV